MVTESQDKFLNLSCKLSLHLPGNIYFITYLEGLFGVMTYLVVPPKPHAVVDVSFLQGVNLESVTLELIRGTRLGSRDLGLSM